MLMFLGAFSLISDLVIMKTKYEPCHQTLKALCKETRESIGINCNSDPYLFSIAMIWVWFECIPQGFIC
jgi:hypothetical protein